MYQSENAVVKPRYFLYARKSSEADDRQVQSIDDQINRLQEMANHLGLDIIDVLTESKSAKEPKIRPVFNEMMLRIDKGDADAILCWQYNRLSRNPIDSAQISWFLQREVLKEVRTIDRTYLPSDNVLLLNIESGSANQFIIDLRKNTKRGIRGKIERGGFPGVPPLGYKNDVINKTIVKDAERFMVMRKCWDMLLEGGHTVSEIMEIAHTKFALTTPKRKRRGGNPIGQATWYRIFHNPFYTGLFQYDGKTYKGNHVPMITMEEYEQVQAILGNKNQIRPKTHEFAFTGLIRCGDCGCMVTAQEKQKLIKSTGKQAKYVYYRCTRRKQGIKCKEPSITLPLLEKQILGEIERFTIPEEFKDWALSEMREQHEAEVALRNGSRYVNEKRYVEIQQKIDTLTDLRLKDLLTDVEYASRKIILQKELIIAKERLDENHNSAEEWLKKMEQAFDFVTHARERFIKGGLKEKRIILQTLGQSFVLKDKVVTFERSEWINPISNHRNGIVKAAATLEPEAFVSTKSKNEALNLAFRSWGGQRGSNP